MAACQCVVGGEVEAGNDGSVDVGLAVPHQFPCLVFLLYVGDLCVGQVIGEREIWTWILTIYPRDVRFECVDDVSLYFP